MKTQAIFFAFDLFGSAGTAAGVHLLADELREVLADNRRETIMTRARAYTRQVRVHEVDFPDLETLNSWRDRGRQLVQAILRQGDFLLWVSGNHLGVLPVYDELAARDEKVLIVQLDAHLDIHHFRDCSTELSHGNFLLHVEGGCPPVVNVGHRDLLLPTDHIARYYRATFPASRLSCSPGEVWEALRHIIDKTDRVYLDIDCDVFDPGSFPAVGQPVPFGLSPESTLGVIEAVWSDKVRGVFLSEFDPARDREDCSLAQLVWLIEYLLLRRYERP
jgi:arginase family enzyme